MPTPHRLAAAVLAGALALGLSGCVPLATAPAFPATGPDSDPTGAAAAAEVHRADRDLAGGRIVEDQRDEAITVLPEHANGGLVVYLHGWGQTRWALLERPSESRVLDALTAAGFTVLGADADLKAWGDAASVEDYRTLIARTMARRHLTEVFLMGESMGGLATMQLARDLPAVRAVTAWYPVCDLSTMRQTRFQQSIDDAWDGADRAAVSPVPVADKPMLIWASPTDTVVQASRNAAVCAEEGRAAGADVTYFHTVGQHGDPSNFVPARIVSFFEQHLGRTAARTVVRAAGA